MRLKHIPLIVLSGLLWFGIGIFLMTLGLNFIVEAAANKETPSFLIRTFTKLAGNQEQSALFLIVIGLALGFIKGRVVLAKSAARVVKRILSLPNPVPLSQAYGKGYLMLIAGMVMLGMSLKWLQLPLDFRGLIDVAIGSALMNGAIAYIRHADAIRKQRS
ncbi:MAG: hypothetical protein K2P51_04705 [Rhabdochlamydiaceae bacterium]|nr:hypothetical protein [Rhabdochlamydiaceae bacterium]